MNLLVLITLSIAISDLRSLTIRGKQTNEWKRNKETKERNKQTNERTNGKETN
jgi:hypothetical protein